MTEHKDSATATDGVIDWIAEVREPSVFYIRGEPILIEEIMKQASVFPDLLAALKRIFNGFEKTGSWPLWATHQSFNGDPAEVSAWEQARAAISKAE